MSRIQLASATGGFDLSSRIALESPGSQIYGSLTNSDKQGNGHQGADPGGHNLWINESLKYLYQ